MRAVKMGGVYMPNSIKFMIFSIIGYIVFYAAAFFFPFLAFVPMCFGVLAALSLVTFIFQKIQTRHHFIKSGLSFFIFGVFFLIMSLVSDITGMNAHTEMILIQINQLIFCISPKLSATFLYLR